MRRLGSHEERRAHEEQRLVTRIIRSKKRSHAKKVRAAKAHAREIYDLQTREFLMRSLAEGKTFTAISKILGHPPTLLGKYRNQSIRESIWRQQIYDEQARFYGPASQAARISKMSDPARPLMAALPAPNGEVYDGEVIGGGSSSPSASAPTASTTGTVLDSPDVLALKQRCLQLRKAALPYDVIADRLGITEQEARGYTNLLLEEHRASEATYADQHRQMMIEQLDQMIAAIHAPATGQTEDGDPHPVMFEAIDRMLKLLKQKAELMGLNQPPAIDIRVKLQQMAVEGGYDIVDLEDITKDVLSSQKLKLPEFR